MNDLTHIDFNTDFDTDTDFNILIVDDVIENIELAMTILKDENYNLFYALSGQECLQLVEAEPEKFDFILLDVMMPDMDGFEVCKTLKASPKTRGIPIIFVTALDNGEAVAKGFKSGGIDYITKPFYHVELLVKVENHLLLRQTKQFLTTHNLSLEKKLTDSYAKYLADLEETQHELMMMMLTFLEASNVETGQHVQRTSELSAILAKHHPDLDAEDENLIYHASQLHDIGNIAIPPEILHHKGTLTQEQHEIMKSHAGIGYKMLSKSSKKFFVKAATIAYEHHENWDGSGYPRGLCGKNIDIYARIVSIADSLDYLTHAHANQPAWSFEVTLNYIEELKGIKFDPQLVNILIDHQEDFQGGLDL